MICYNVIAISLLVYSFQSVQSIPIFSGIFKNADYR